MIIGRLLALALCFAGVRAIGSGVSLAWDPSVSADVVGYRLYEGAASQTYTNVVDVGNTTNATLTGLLQGVTYFFAVTAYDAIGLESVYSNEASYSVPTPAGARMQLTLDQSGQPSITATGPAGYQYAVQTSQDLTNWTAVVTVTLDPTGSAQYTDTSPASGSTRYYRLLQSAPAQAVQNPKAILGTLK